MKSPFTVIISLWNFFLALFGVVRPPQAPAIHYSSPDFTVQEVGDCVDGSRVWIYTPKTLAPDRNVVVYLHGFSASLPVIYQGHIEHIVRQGQIVLYPQFQEGYCMDNQQVIAGFGQLLGTQSPAEWAQRAADRVRDVLDNELDDGDYNKVFLYGHSLGGAIGMMWSSLSNAVNVKAAVLASPQPGGFQAIPGAVTTLLPFFFGEDIDVLSAAPFTKFPIAILHAADDNIAPLSDLYPSYDALGSEYKIIYQAQTDSHGYPAIKANHITPTSIGLLGEIDINAFDRRYYWSALDQVMDGTEVASLVFDLGEWSDGTPVLEVLKL